MDHPSDINRGTSHVGIVKRGFRLEYSALHDLNRFDVRLLATGVVRHISVKIRRDDLTGRFVIERNLRVDEGAALIRAKRSNVEVDTNGFRGLMHDVHVLK